VVYQQLSTGDSGDEVENLQQRLKDLNTIPARWTAATVRRRPTAVKRFQSTLGLDTTGIATAKPAADDLLLRGAHLYRKLLYRH
jgi:peptidoglycan hydrolase-like protein with peptidoglycan-binding domain